MTNDQRPATRMLSSLRRLDEAKGAVPVEDVYDADIADLWSALTDPRRLERLDSLCTRTAALKAGRAQDQACRRAIWLFK
jgi:hypothetical protein